MALWSPTFRQTATMSRMTCPTCHNELPEDETACPTCAAEGDVEPTVIFVPVQPGQHPSLSPAEAAHADGVPGYALVVDRGPVAGMTYVLNPGTTTVGRHPDSDIFLDDITVSRHHCRFMVSEGGLVVEDSGSTNGTYVRDVGVERAPLQAGDEIIVGKFHLIVALGDA